MQTREYASSALVQGRGLDQVTSEWAEEKIVVVVSVQAPMLNQAFKELSVPRPAEQVTSVKVALAP